jgi:hypothetical protein
MLVFSNTFIIIKFRDELRDVYNRAALGRLLQVLAYIASWTEFNARRLRKPLKRLEFNTKNLPALVESLFLLNTNLALPGGALQGKYHVIALEIQSKAEPSKA